jgi:hypothetical protein|tara:strand:+ start:2218 stop:4653 length:2436 start_codon:yes stop_codon:yes gene_type:complete
MPKQVHYIRDFSGGINSQRNPRDISDNQTPFCQDAMGDRIGMLRTMGNGEGDLRQKGNSSSTKAVSTLSSTDLSNANGYGFKHYELDYAVDGSEEEGGEHYFAVVNTNGRLRVWDYTNDTWDILPQKYQITGSIDVTGTNTAVPGTGTAFDSEVSAQDNIIVSGETRTIASVTNATTAAVTANWGSDLANDTSPDIKKSIDLGAGTDIKANITAFDNGLRICDSNLDNSSTPKYFKYIKRSQLGRNRDGFYGGANTLLAPSGCDLVTSATYEDGLINFKITSEDDGVGSWKKTDYAFACSFVYDGNQESALEEISTSGGDTLAAADVNADRPWVVAVYAANATKITDYDARITGARIYWKYWDEENEKVEEGEWNLLVDCDFTGAAGVTKSFGIRGKLSDRFKDWTISSNDAIATIVIQDPSIDTYATINGYSSNDGNLYIGNSGDGYKAAVYANRRMFVAGVRMTFEDGVQRQKLDRIMYSPVGKPDVFPLSNYIDIVQSDAEPYIKLEAVGDKLFAFKSDNLYVANIAGYASDWYLESTNKGMGVLSGGAVFRTDYGLVWVNPNGLYNYTAGGGISELTEDKVLSGYKTDSYSKPSWGKLITAGTIIGYDKKEKEIVIVLNSGSATNDQSFGGNGADVIVYDLETKSFFFGKNRLLSGGIASNFDYDWNGDLVYTTETSDVIDIKKWQSDDQTSTAFVYQTKDFDFGHPSRYKKIYAIYLTYKHSHGTAASNFVKYVQDGGTSFITTNLSNNSFDQATVFKIQKVTFSTPLKCQSIALQFNGGSNATKIEINDIGIEYRLLPSAKMEDT